MLGAKGTRHERGACGANGAAPSAATRDEVMKQVLASDVLSIVRRRVDVDEIELFRSCDLKRGGMFWGSA